jgi:hypothetical protein
VDRVVIPAIVAILVVAAMSAYSARGQGENDVVYYACLTSRTGQLYHVRFNEQPRCQFGDQVISWNQTGPAGQVGEQGSPGMSGYEIQTIEWPTIGVDWLVFQTVDCPEGKVAVGGGVRIDHSNLSESREHRLIGSHPTDDGTGWRSGILNMSETTEELPSATWYAVCVNVENDLNDTEAR